MRPLYSGRSLWAGGRYSEVVFSSGLTVYPKLISVPFVKSYPEAKAKVEANGYPEPTT